MNIKKSTRKALAELGESQTWLGEQLGTTRSQVSRWVTSEHLSTSVIEKIAKVFGMTVAEFIALGE
jgi:plasmid maintenance system antidote protein VapI